MEAERDVQAAEAAAMERGHDTDTSFDAGPAESAADAGASSGVDAAARCLAAYPATLPFDVGETPFDGELYAPPGPDAGAPVRSAETIAALCARRGGVECDPEKFISRSAALCIADAEGMIAPGEQSRRAGLMVAEGSRVVWSVEVVYPTDDPYCFGYLVLYVDAVSGRVVSSAALGGCA